MLNGGHGLVCDLILFSVTIDSLSALRYIRNPAGDPNFEVFFTKPWLETFTVSLHNFLTTIFQSVRILFRTYAPPHASVPA